MKKSKVSFESLIKNICENHNKWIKNKSVDNGGSYPGIEDNEFLTPEQRRRIELNLAKNTDRYYEGISDDELSDNIGDSGNHTSLKRINDYLDNLIDEKEEAIYNPPVNLEEDAEDDVSEELDDEDADIAEIASRLTPTKEKQKRYSVEKYKKSRENNIKKREDDVTEADEFEEDLFLTKDEETALFAMLDRNDVDEETKIQNKQIIILNMLGFIIKMARHYYVMIGGENNNIQMYDIVLAYINIIQELFDRFNWKLGNSFSTYAKDYIKRIGWKELLKMSMQVSFGAENPDVIMNFIRDNNVGFTSLNARIGGDGEGDADYESVISHTSGSDDEYTNDVNEGEASESPSVENMDSEVYSDRMRNILADLIDLDEFEPDEIKVLNALYLNDKGLSLDEVAEELGFKSAQEVSDINDTLLYKLRTNDRMKYLFKLRNESLFNSLNEKQKLVIYSIAVGKNLLTESFGYETLTYINNRMLKGMTIQDFVEYSLGRMI